MEANKIIVELKKIVDHGITPGQAFDAICNLRREQVTWDQLCAALAPSADTPLEKVPSASGDFTDTTPMPFGKYRGTPLGKVDAAYLCWLWSTRPLSNPKLEAYIKANLESLKDEHPDGIWE